MNHIENDQYVVAYQDDERTKQALFDRVIAFYKEHESFSGESVMQMDGPQLAAPELLADIVDDILKMSVTWK